MPDTWAHLADRYEQAYGPKPESPCWSRAQSLARGARGRVLDIACGPGYDLALFLQAVGIDSSPGMLLAAKQRAPAAALVLGDMRYLPFKHGSFAAAFSCLALIHLTKAELSAVLVEVRTLLEPDAQLSAVFFAGAGEKDTGFSPLVLRAVAHYSYYQAEELVRVFTGAGYAAVEVEDDILNEPTHAAIPCLCVRARS